MLLFIWSLFIKNNLKKGIQLKKEEFCLSKNWWCIAFINEIINHFLGKTILSEYSVIFDIIPLHVKKPEIKSKIYLFKIPITINFLPERFLLEKSYSTTRKSVYLHIYKF